MVRAANVHGPEETTTPVVSMEAFQLRRVSQGFGYVLTYVEANCDRIMDELDRTITIAFRELRPDIIIGAIFFPVDRLRPSGRPGSRTDPGDQTVEVNGAVLVELRHDQITDPGTFLVLVLDPLHQLLYTIIQGVAIPTGAVKGQGNEKLPVVTQGDLTHKVFRPGKGALELAYELFFGLLLFFLTYFERVIQALCNAYKELTIAAYPV